MSPDDDTLLERLQASARRQHTPCGEGRMVWHSWGAGPPLVLLHGGSGSWRHWARNIGPLARHRRVLAPDLPGLGDSALPPPGTPLPGYVALIAQGIEALLGAGARYDLAGFSFGGILAGQLAAAAGGRVRSLTLLGAGGLGLPRLPFTLAKVRRETGEARTAAHRHNLSVLMLAEAGRIDALALRIQAWNSDHTRLSSLGLVPEGALRAVLPEICAPLHVIFGEFDAIAYPYMAAREALFQSLRPPVPLHVVPGAGHWVGFEAPEAVNGLIERLLPAMD